MSKPRLLGVLLCYNDGDILSDTIASLLNSNHDVIAWDHGSSDETPQVLDTFKGQLLEATFIPRSVDFYEIYPRMSRHLLERYVKEYDWITWPDQDEIVEGPTRSKTYDDYVQEVWESPHNWIQFGNFVYWFTPSDNSSVASPVERIRHYSLLPGRPPLIRAWRASATNIRWFNHNPAQGTKYPEHFRLRHYPMRSAEQMRRRLLVDRAGIRRGHINFHYGAMQSRQDELTITASQLHHDDGRSELNPAPVFDWRRVYGEPPELPVAERDAWVLAISRWHAAWSVATGIRHVLTSEQCDRQAGDRLKRWLAQVDERRDEVAAIVIEPAASESRVVTESMINDGNAGEGGRRVVGSWRPDGGVAADLVLDADRRRVEIRFVDRPSQGSPLTALVPYGREEATAIQAANGHVVCFENLGPGRYIIAVEPLVTETRALG